MENAKWRMENGRLGLAFGAGYNGTIVLGWSLPLMPLAAQNLFQASASSSASTSSSGEATGVGHCSVTRKRGTPAAAWAEDAGEGTGSAVAGAPDVAVVVDLGMG